MKLESIPFSAAVIIALLAAGCATLAADIPDVQFERETHPNAKLLEVARDVPGFGGKFFDGQGRLNVYMLEPGDVPAEAKSSLANAFSVDADGIVFVEGQYTVAQLAQWYYADGVVSLVEDEDVAGTLLWDEQNRLALFLDAVLWDEHNHSAQLLKMEADVERLEGRIDAMGVPADAVVFRLTGGLADDNWTSSAHYLPPPLTSPYAWPEEYRTALDDETLVLFGYSHPTAELLLIPSARVLHVPSGSRGRVWWDHLGDAGVGVSLDEELGTAEGRAHIDSFLHDRVLVEDIGEDVKRIWHEAWG